MRPDRYEFPQITLIEEGMREGLQIESVAIPTDRKVELLNALSDTGLRYIAVGSFVSPKWVPQMADVDEVIRRFTPNPAVEYRALALNDAGRARYASHVPPLAPPPQRPRTMVHACDVFVRRNTNRSQQDEIATWPRIIERARSAGAKDSRIGVNAAWGSNWLGRFTAETRMRLLTAQYELWEAANIRPAEIFLGDPMGWNTPTEVAAQLDEIRSRWPGVKTFHLHLHNTRGMALASSYAAMRRLDSSCHLVLDTCIGGMGGCPYCGNGRAAGLLATEDTVQMLEADGLDTGIDLRKLVEVVVLAEDIVGHQLYGHVSKAGPLPSPEDLYPLDLPLIETLEEAQHFRLGRSAFSKSATSGPDPAAPSTRRI